jgi:lipopolysaccharide/colanic/teichoic acid biosynthesis glycosyltransferase
VHRKGVRRCVLCADAISPEDMYKFAYKPGITRLAQINGRGLHWAETLGWDLQYFRHGASGWT